MSAERRLQDLLAYPREDLAIELKGWLDLRSEEDKANLAHAILALANHGGGYIILGFQEVAGTWAPQKSRPPGPKSEAPQSAHEWDELISRSVRAAKEELIEGIRNLLSGVPLATPASAIGEATTQDKLDTWIQESMKRLRALVAEKLPDEKPSRYEHGVWHVAYRVVSTFPKPSLTDLLTFLRNVKGHETGWPPWWVPTNPKLAPYVYNGTVECWLRENTFGDPAHSDFWRSAPKVMMYLLRGYQEDSVPQSLPPGTIFDLTIPVWEVGACLLHAERFAKAIREQPIAIDFQVTWTGLAGRELTAWSSPRRALSSGRRSRQSEVSSRIQIQSDKISETLTEIVATLTQPLYEIFDFFTAPK